MRPGPSATSWYSSATAVRHATSRFLRLFWPAIFEMGRASRKKNSSTCGLIQIDEPGLCPVLAEAAPTVSQGEILLPRLCEFDCRALRALCFVYYSAECSL